MKKRLLYLLFVLLFSINCFSQFSKTHYIPPLSGSSSLQSEEQYIYISTPNLTPVNFRIIELGGNTILGTVSRNVPYVYNVGFGNNTQLHVDGSITSTILNNKGYIVEADDLIYVSARVTAANGNQAGELVSKGLAALGLRFRVGAFTNTLVQNYIDIHYTFVSVLATENNTTVTFSGMKPNVQLVNSGTGSSTVSVTLNRGESYVMAVQGPTPENRDGLIGALVEADKPIALNCGSFGGSNAVGNLDLGFDQIVPAERISSNDYIFIKSTGIDEVEKILLVADENNTTITLNGSTPTITILNAGDYLALTGSDYNANGNLFVSADKKVFAYQAIGDDGAVDQRNQELFFVPPLSCQTPRVIDNIPFIDFVGGRQFIGRITMVTRTASTLNFIINGTNYTLAGLASIGVNVNGPIPVIGNTNYETYVMTGVTGNVSVYSSSELYLAAYGSEQAATFGGFYSGFTFKPEISFNEVDITQLGCIPNTILKVNALSPFDVFQWYFNGVIIPGATNNTYQPLDIGQPVINPTGLGPGYYFVSATIAGCTSPKDSDIIPVSSCPSDTDNDGINDNVDLDNDNDGITNCTESFGNQYFNLTNTTVGTIAVGTYSNSYTGAVTFAGTGTPSVTPIVGAADGNFVTEAALGIDNSVSYTVSNFTSPISISVEYASVANAADLFTSSSEIRIACPVNKTLTVLNPNNQLLIDTNYDGFFESGITEYSSFEIRIRLNNSVPLAAGTGTFSIRGNLINSIIITNINLSDSSTSKVALRLIASCIPKDFDGDGIADQNDYDSDNDGILDFIESQGTTILALSHVDVNADGIDDAFGSGIIPSDTDNDGVLNYLDLDSDNDGIHDLDESGFNTVDANNNGVIDGANFGTNGLSNSLETSPDSGIIKPIYVLADTDSDGNYNYTELDSDNDLCNDVIEAGYLDSNLDGLLGGTTPPTINTNGLVTSGIGYGNPNANYITAAPIVITTQPQSASACELQGVTFSVVSNVVNNYQWQLSIDGGINWLILTNNASYSGVNTNSLTVSNVTPAMVGYQYRVYLIKTGNTCGLLSSAAILTTYALPVITTPITLKQCDDDTDGISIFNLTQKNDVISANYLVEIFTYYTTSAAASNQNNTFLIANPIAYTSGSASVYARVENANGCFRVAQIDLIVSVTQIPANFVIPNKYLCDDYQDAVNNDRDGISGPFNFSNVTASLLAILPNNVSVKYYKTQADFLAETDATGNSLAITNPTNYRNIGFPNTQTIWVRVDSTLDNSCFGFKTFDVVVEALPTANPINALNLLRHCDDDQNGIYGFDTSTIQPTVLNGQTGVNVTYFRANGTQLSSPLPNPFQVNGTETITIKVNNNTTQTGGTPCYDDETLQFIVDDLPEAFAISANLTSICDEESNPVDQDGQYDFDTTNFESTILGSQTGMLISYTLQNGTVLSQLRNPFRTGTQNVLVTVTNPINTMCIAQYTIPFIVYPTPKIDLEESIIICLPATDALIDGGILDGSLPSDYQYLWYTNGVPNGVTSPTLLVNTPGVYSVDVTNAFGCTKTRVITVTGSQIASIQSIDVVDLAEINSILVNVTGLGDYEFSIDDVNGPYRDSNFFTNVPMGLHEIYIRDKNGCGSLGPITVPVLGIPHYFTPNGDGYNDYWNVKGVNAQFNYLSRILIFDRFGKLLKQIGTTGLGWDGTFNDHPMPADDYWYNIQFEDGRSAKGHFALKR